VERWKERELNAETQRAQRRDGAEKRRRREETAQRRGAERGRKFATV